MTKQRRPTPKPAQHSARLLKILEGNMQRATSPELRMRLQSAIDSIKKRAA
jgi:hypothetical protein